MKDLLQDAIQLRENNKPKEALDLLKKLLKTSPSDPVLNYQVAWTYDQMGKESDAVFYYEEAIENGISGEELKGALLGLGSTLRCLGEYSKSLEVFNKAIKEFPKDRALKIFRALTLYNLEKFSGSVRELLLQLVETTSDENIKSYSRALKFYSDKLDQTWE